MERFTDNKIVLVTRRTRLDDLIQRHNTLDQARFYVEHLGADFKDYLDEHANYYAALKQCLAVLEQLGRVQTVDRSFLPTFLFGPEDTVLALGQDGMVANTLKYLDGQALFGVNPDPARWDGVLLPFLPNDLGDAIQALWAGRMNITEITMAKAELSDGQVLYGVNDLFIGRQTHVSARYLLRDRGVEEAQSSSGIIVSTGLGSTGWMSSILNGASAVVAGVRAQQRPQLPPVNRDWGSSSLYYAVREPFVSRHSGAELVFGEVRRGKALEVTSQMPEAGVIFSDGIETDFLAFASGLKATIGIAEKRGYLVVT